MAERVEAEVPRALACAWCRRRATTRRRREAVPPGGAVVCERCGKTSLVPERALLVIVPFVAFIVFGYVYSTVYVYRYANYREMVFVVFVAAPLFVASLRAATRVGARLRLVRPR
jgi:hypothetical protein